MEHKTVTPAVSLPTLFCALFFTLFSSVSAQSCTSHVFSNNNQYATCTALPVLDAFLHWTYDETTATINVAFRRVGGQNAQSSWVAWGLNPSGQQMLGTQAIVAYTNSSTGQFRAYTAPVTGLDTQLQEGSLSFGVSRVSASLVAGEVVLFATIELPADMVSTNQVWQVGPIIGGVPSAHQRSGDNLRSVGRIDFQSGIARTGGGDLSSRQRRRNTHGVLNAVSWGIVIPVGAIMARYVKVFPGSVWFYLHIACQVSGFVVGVAGWATGIKLGNDSPGTSYSTHRNIGISIFVFATLQVFALFVRPKPDNKYRVYWNIYHRGIGYATIILSIVNIFKGFDILDPDDKWKRAYIGVIISLGVASLFLEALTWFLVLKTKKTDNAVSNKPSQNSNGNAAEDRAYQTRQTV